MTKNYTLPSGAELVLNHNISKPVLDVWQIKTEILLNGETLGKMTAYNGAVPALRRITDCFELNVFFNRVNKIYFKPYDTFTIITDVKIERDFAPEFQVRIKNSKTLFTIFEKRLISVNRWRIIYMR